MFITGSSNIWVPSSKCNDSYFSSQNTYNSNLSSSYIPNGNDFNISYAEGTDVLGIISQETVDIVFTVHFRTNLDRNKMEHKWKQHKKERHIRKYP